MWRFLPRPGIDSQLSHEADEFEGTVQGVGNTSIVVDGKTMMINGDTEIKGTLAVGDKVEIEAVRQNDGSLLATAVEVEGSTDAIGLDDDEVHTDADD